MAPFVVLLHCRMCTSVILRGFSLDQNRNQMFASLKQSELAIVLQVYRYRNPSQGIRLWLAQMVVIIVWEKISTINHHSITPSARFMHNTRLSNASSLKIAILKIIQILIYTLYNYTENTLYQSVSSWYFIKSLLLMLHRQTQFWGISAKNCNIYHFFKMQSKRFCLSY